MQLFASAFFGGGVQISANNFKTLLRPLVRDPSWSISKFLVLHKPYVKILYPKLELFLKIFYKVEVCMLSEELLKFLWLLEINKLTEIFIMGLCWHNIQKNFQNSWISLFSSFRNITWYLKTWKLKLLFCF